MTDIENQIETIREYHSNGQLRYIRSIKYISAGDAEKYQEKLIVKEDGRMFINVRQIKKYFDNGQLAWELNYTDEGDLLREKTKQFSRDGKAIPCC